MDSPVLDLWPRLLLGYRQHCTLSRDMGCCAGLAARGLSGALPCRCSDWQCPSHGWDSADVEYLRGHRHHSEPARFSIQRGSPAYPQQGMKMKEWEAGGQPRLPQMPAWRIHGTDGTFRKELGTWAEPTAAFRKEGTW